MRLLFDIRSAQTYHGRGVFRYAFDLALYLARHRGSKDSLVLLYDKKSSKIDFTACDRVSLPCVDIADFDSVCGTDYFDARIIGTFIYFSCPVKWGYIDHLYPENVVKRCGKTIAIIHDFIPAVYPEECLYTYQDKINFALQVEALKLADLYLCNSKFTLETAIHYLKRPAEDFICIYGSSDFDKFKTDMSDKPYHMTDRKNHLIYVGGPIHRKNYMGLVKAFVKAYHGRKLPLDARVYIVCSKAKNFESEIKSYLDSHAMEFGKHVICTGFISDETLLDLLKSARASVFPSFYEGLGLPILESYVAGTPSFAANTSSTVEFVSPDSSFDPADIDQMAHVIERVYTDEDYCARSLEFGRKLIQTLNWDNIAMNVWKSLKDLKK